MKQLEASESESDMLHGLLDSVARTPADDTPRLILADWLEEHGSLYGELIRTQCALAQDRQQGPHRRFRRAKYTDATLRPGMLTGNELYRLRARNKELLRLLQPRQYWRGEFEYQETALRWRGRPRKQQMVASRPQAQRGFYPPWHTLHVLQPWPSGQPAALYWYTLGHAHFGLLDWEQVLFPLAARVLSRLQALRFRHMRGGYQHIVATLDSLTSWPCLAKLELPYAGDHLHVSRPARSPSAAAILRVIGARAQCLTYLELDGRIRFQPEDLALFHLPGFQQLQQLRLPGFTWTEDTVWRLLASGLPTAAIVDLLLHSKAPLAAVQAAFRQLPGGSLAAPPALLGKLLTYYQLT
jgi:uncharacterized protein (TIGR02996 family)